MDNEIVEIKTIPQEVTLAHDPTKVLAEAKRAAVALVDVVKQKKKPVIMNGEQYLEFEDWQTVGRFYGVTTKVTKTDLIKIDNVIGYEASAEVIRLSDGMTISAATAMCLNDEDKWSKRAKYEYVKGQRVKVGEVAVPLFQLRSMAQTRACAKALRNVLSWVVVLAGYKPTPAEELTGNEVAPAPVQTPQPAAPIAKELMPDPDDMVSMADMPVEPEVIPPPPPTTPLPTNLITDKQRKRLYAISMNAGMTEVTFKTWLKTQGYNSSKDITRADYDRICSEAEAYNPIGG